MKQTEIAKLAGISPAYMSMILAGERRPSWELAKKLGEITGTDPAVWMDGGAEERKKMLEK